MPLSRRLLFVGATCCARQTAAAPPEIRPRRGARPVTVAAAPGWDGPFTLGLLLTRLAAPAERRARFQEERRLAALDRPLESEGTLHWRRPDFLEKRTIWPRPERVTVTGERVDLTGPEGTTRGIDLASEPELRGLIDALRAPLAGDAAALERSFVATLDGDPVAWTLRLEPRERRARRLIAAVTIRGTLADPLGIEVLENSGDSQVLRLEPLP